MKKAEIRILALILVWIIIGDVFLFRIYNKVEHTRKTLMMENMYNKNDIVLELQNLGRALY